MQNQIMANPIKMIDVKDGTVTLNTDRANAKIEQILNRADKCLSEDEAREFIADVMNEVASLDDPHLIINIDLDFGYINIDWWGTRYLLYDVSSFDRFINLVRLRLDCKIVCECIVHIKGIHSLSKCSKLVYLDLCWDGFTNCGLWWYAWVRSQIPWVFIDDCLPKSDTSDCVKSYMDRVHKYTRRRYADEIRQIDDEDDEGDEDEITTSAKEFALVKAISQDDGFTDAEVYKVIWKWITERNFEDDDDQITVDKHWRNLFGSYIIIHELE